MSYRSPGGLDYEQRVKDLMEAWAPQHAKELMEQGWRLSDGQGLTWVRNDKPGLLLPDDRARSLYYRRSDLVSAIKSAGDYRDWHRCDRLEKELAELLTMPEYIPKGSAHVAIVTGGRDYNLTDADREWLGKMWERFGFRIVLHGDCKTGVDRQAAAWARSLGLCDAACPAPWDEWRKRYGSPKGAGPNRNHRMAKACALPMYAVCLAFPGGRGTENMKENARLYNINVLEAPRN